MTTRRVAPAIQLTLRGLLLAGTLVTCANAGATIALENWWVRALPPSQTMTAAYGSITNTGAAAMTLSGATTEAAQRVELHTTQQSDGQVRMLPMAFPTLAPGERLVLEPGGPHLMLIGVTTMPALGSTVTLCVQMTTGEPACTDANVRRTAPMDHSNHSMHH